MVKGGMCGEGGMHGEGGHAWQRGRGVAGEMATAAGSTLPTGMHFCLKKIWRTYVHFMGPLISLFWTSGDVSYGFQSQNLQLYLCLTEAYVLHVP